MVSEIVINEIKCWHCLLMHFHALASFQQGVNINSVHRPCHMVELPRGNPHARLFRSCYKPTLFELPTTATNQLTCFFLFFFCLFCIEMEKCPCRFRKCMILYKNLTSHVSVCSDPANLSERQKEIIEKN